MNPVLKFIHRRALPTVIAGVMSMRGFVGGLAPIEAVAKVKDETRAEKRAKERGRLAADLDDELKAPREIVFQRHHVQR